MINKKYLNISEVSKLLQIEEHKIRYWDSVDPKTNKHRVLGISTKSKGGTRYFNRENIKRIQKLKSILYDEGNNNSLKLAEKLIASKSNLIAEKDQNNENKVISDDAEKIEQILNKMRLLLKKKT